MNMKNLMSITVFVLSIVAVAHSSISMLHIYEMDRMYVQDVNNTITRVKELIGKLEELRHKRENEIANPKSEY